MENAWNSTKGIASLRRERSLWMSIRLWIKHFRFLERVSLIWSHRICKILKEFRILFILVQLLWSQLTELGKSHYVKSGSRGESESFLCRENSKLVLLNPPAIITYCLININAMNHFLLYLREETCCDMSSWKKGKKKKIYISRVGNIHERVSRKFINANYDKLRRSRELMYVLDVRNTTLN